MEIFEGKALIESGKYKNINSIKLMTQFGVCVQDKYVQNRNRKGTHPHWEGKPAGSSLAGKTCWLCSKGCAVLSYMYWKNIEPNETNVKGCLNENADFVWGRKGLVRSSEIVAPSVAKLKGRGHYVHIVKKSPAGDGTFVVFDPDGGKVYAKGPGFFECCFK